MRKLRSVFYDLQNVIFIIYSFESWAQAKVECEQNPSDKTTENQYYPDNQSDFSQDDTEQIQWLTVTKNGHFEVDLLRTEVAMGTSISLSDLQHPDFYE